jgi:hypothetical protein
LPLLNMGMVPTDTASLDASILAYMEARGVNLSGEQLPQNITTVHLGHVMPGARLVFRVKDLESKQVNRGVTYSLSSDTDQYTVDLEGNVIENPSFVLADD